MEIKVNKEIRGYRESIFFGLSVRQFACSVVAVGVAVGTYFGLRDIVGKETVSWLCMVLAAPFAAAGFFQYNGMTLERFILAFIRSEFLCAGQRLYKSENIIFNAYREVLHAKKTRKKRRKKKNTEDGPAVDTD